jgi:hypothetical protein
LANVEYAVKLFFTDKREQIVKGTDKPWNAMDAREAMMNLTDSYGPQLEAATIVEVPKSPET